MANVLLVSHSPNPMAVAMITTRGHDPTEVLSISDGLAKAKNLPYDSIIVLEHNGNNKEISTFFKRMECYGLNHRVILHYDPNEHMGIKKHESRLCAELLQTPTFDKTLITTIESNLPGIKDCSVLPGKIFQQKGEAADNLMFKVGRIGPLDCNVTIVGDIGQGKDRICQSLHEYSRRSDKPIMFVRHYDYVQRQECRNGCGACYLEKCFKEVEGGSIVLLDLPQYCRKGQACVAAHSHNPDCNVRIIATAERKAMMKVVEDGEFDRNLWNELSATMIELPPLKECPDAIEWLANDILDHFCKVNKRPQLYITDDAMMILKTLPWPGNVMELSSVITQRAALCVGDKMNACDFFDLITIDEDITGESDEQKVTRLLITSPSVEIAAKRYGKSESTFYGRMRKFNLDSNGQKKKKKQKSGATVTV